MLTFFFLIWYQFIINISITYINRIMKTIQHLFFDINFFYFIRIDLYMIFDLNRFFLSNLQLYFYSYLKAEFYNYFILQKSHLRNNCNLSKTHSILQQIMTTIACRRLTTKSYLRGIISFLTVYTYRNTKSIIIKSYT